ncbi:MAG: argininosuccinate lyase, partial [Evtepia gabavorous]
NMFRRDITRLEDCRARLDESPLGSGALATSTHPVDRFRTAELLGFSKPMDNSLDGVSDRDFAIEFLSACSILMMHLSRFSEELILWCSWEFQFITLDDAYATGSSIMPQKKNPDVAELVRGKTGRVYGALITLLTVMKGIPLAYNKDMQEDKEPVFDTIDTVELCLPVFTAMIDTLTVNRANMRRAANGGFISATDCADYLAKKGMPFREAYGIVGKLVGHCMDTGHSLETLPLEEYQKVSPYFQADVYDALSLETCVEGRKVYGGPAPEAVKVQMEHLKQFIQEREA